MTTDQKHPMRVDIDLDWATAICPCGEEYCSRYEQGSGKWQAFFALHMPHTNGMILDHITPDGERACGPTPDRTYKWTATS